MRSNVTDPARWQKEAGEEIYFVFEELQKAFPNMKFEQGSYCAGILSLHHAEKQNRQGPAACFAFAVAACMLNTFLRLPHLFSFYEPFRKDAAAVHKQKTVLTVCCRY